MRNPTIIVITSGGIGDVLLATPALRELRRRHPQKLISVYCKSRAHYDVLYNNPNIDRVLLIPRWISRIKKNWIRWLALFGRYPIDCARWGLGLGSPRRIDYGNLVPTVVGQHATELIGNMLGVSVTDRKLDYFPTAEEEKAARNTLKNIQTPVAIHVTSRCCQNQNWPVEQWELLVRKHADITFIQLGESGEPPIAGTLDLRGKTSLRESIALLKYCRTFSGVVSSMAHATCVVSTPGVILFGPSSPGIWGHDQNVNIYKRLRCAPCVDFTIGAACPYGAKCMHEISVGEVSEALLEVLGRRPPNHPALTRVLG